MSHTAACSYLSRFGRVGWAVIVCLAATAGLIAAEASSKVPDGKSRAGQEIYRQQCASCHGAAGEGSADSYPRPLTGDRSLGQLAGFIEKSMPEDKPGSCVGDDARNVAAYIYDAFYSPAARARNQPARVELSRLTVNQYANVVADLVGSFRERTMHDDPPGLKAKYITRRRKGDTVNDDPPIEQIDATIDFEFGDEGPLKGQIKPDEYEIHWRGALLAPETGEYEFNLETSDGGRLWLNDNSRPLIDAWVRSGTKTEHRESIRLLGGRKYPIRVDFSKGKKESARIALKWKLPHGAEEVVPARCLATSEIPEVFVLQTPFPPDDRSMGYERGTSISKEWEHATTEAAIEVAGYVGAHFRQLPGLAAESLGHDLKTRDFCKRIVERA
ncbi:MAG: PA14 domain-containing protein, partial [Thermoguttaceae bacterium]